MRSKGAQQLQTVLLFCLAAVAVSQGPFADSLQRSVASTPSTGDGFSAGLRAVFGMWVPLAAAAVFLRGEALKGAICLATWFARAWACVRRSCCRCNVEL
jgi:hypothetical protein